jgi:hypothetical protein
MTIRGRFGRTTAYAGWQLVVVLIDDADLIEILGDAAASPRIRHGLASAPMQAAGATL